jgi:RNA polymerase sigma-70 factor (ECF subfamily)
LCNGLIIKSINHQYFLWKTKDTAIDFHYYNIKKTQSNYFAFFFVQVSNLSKKIASLYNQMKEIESIIAACLKEQRNAQFMLYEHYAGLMFGICLRYTGNRTDAEDVMQDAFVKIFQNIKSFRQEGSFEGWMKRIMVNTALNYLRTKKKAKFTELTPLMMNSPEENTDIDYEVEPEILMKIIQKLPDGCRTVFNLYTFEDYSHKEIATLLSFTEGTSKSQLSRARKLLTEAVLEYKQKNNYQLAT